jgi:hypothetical protein
MANIKPSGAWLKGQRPGYAQTANVATMSPDQIRELQTLLKNAGFYTGPIGTDLNNLSVLAALGNFQRSGGYGDTSPIVTSDMWYGLNVLSDTVVNQRPVTDLGIWNTLTGAKQLGYTSVDPNAWSYGAPGGVGVAPGNQAPTPPATQPNQPPPNAPPPTAQPDNTSAFASMDAILAEYGLGAGSEFDLRQWARGQAAGPTYNSDVFRQNLLLTEQYKTRFGDVNQKRIANGLSAWTPKEILEYETQAAGILQRAGGPSNFYDNWRDWQGAIAGGWSLAEIADRVDVAKQWTYNLPPEVKQAFANITGAGDLQTVWAYVFDDEKAAPLIERQLTMAEITGAGSRFGIGVDQEMAGTLANLGVTYDRAQQGFQTIDASSGLFAETVGETEDLTKEQTGVAAVFGTGPGAQQALEQRRAARNASVTGGGAFERNQRGITGLGAVG